MGKTERDRRKLQQGKDRCREEEEQQEVGGGDESAGGGGGSYPNLGDCRTSRSLKQSSRKS
eukprot:768554-Hanusia_phi.AAC.10